VIRERLNLRREKSPHKACQVPLFLIGSQREWSMAKDQKQTLEEHLWIVDPRVPLKIHYGAFCRGLRDSVTSGRGDHLVKMLSHRLLEQQASLVPCLQLNLYQRSRDSGFLRPFQSLLLLRKLQMRSCLKWRRKQKKIVDVTLLMWRTGFQPLAWTMIAACPIQLWTGRGHYFIHWKLRKGHALPHP